MALPCHWPKALAFFILTPMKHFVAGSFFPILMSFLSACAMAGPSQGPKSEYALGTVCTINLYDAGRPALYSSAFARLRELEEIFSANREDSDLARVNRNAGLRPVTVRPELIEVLSRALEFAEKSGGLYDPAIGPLVKLWGIGTGNEQVAGNEEISEALALVNYREIEINRQEGTVFLNRPGMALDLGAIAKGYAADEIVKLLAGKGVERAIIDLGGNIFAKGGKKQEKNITGFIKKIFSGKAKQENADGFWRIGVQDPREHRGDYLGILELKNKTIVTSGIYERYFEKDGVRYHHIFSVENGFPAETGLLSVTIVADRSIDADALSTAAFVMGWERGRELIASIPGAEGIFVFDDLAVRTTAGLENCFTLIASDYFQEKQ